MLWIGAFYLLGAGGFYWLALRSAAHVDEAQATHPARIPELLVLSNELVGDEQERAA